MTVNAKLFGMTRLIERIESVAKALKPERRASVLQQGPNTEPEDRALWQALARVATPTSTTVAALERAVDRRFPVRRIGDNT